MRQGGDSASAPDLDELVDRREGGEGLLPFHRCVRPGGDQRRGGQSTRLHGEALGRNVAAARHRPYVQLRSGHGAGVGGVDHFLVVEVCLELDWNTKGDLNKHYV